VGQCERSIYWLDEATGLTCKARLDLMVRHVTVDLKTTDDARPEAFSRQADRLGYDLQAAFYLRGRRALEPNLPATPFVFIAAELNDPFEPQVHVADPEDFVAYGEAKVVQTMRVVAQCQQAGRYPGYSTSMKTLKLPAYRRFPGVEP
jgi:hypothetical protein